MYVSSLFNKSGYSRQIHYINPYPGNGYGFRNLKILTNIDSIDKIELTFEYTRIDSTCPSILKNDIPFDILQNNVLPFINMLYAIIVTHQAKTTISYDIVKILNPREKYNIIGKCISHISIEIYKW